MPTVTFEVEYATDSERLALEQAVAFFTQMKQVAATAPDGTVLSACERVALADGRKLLRDTLSAAVQTRAEAADGKKGVRPGCASAGVRRRGRGTGRGRC